MEALFIMESFISWIGGKKLLRKTIISRFPVGQFDRYIEVFGGAGWVLFGAEKHAPFEVYNDINGDLVNLFRCVKYHCSELQRELQWCLNSREFFMDFREQLSLRGLTDIQRAARFFLLVKLSYGSKRTSFGCVVKNMDGMIRYLSEAQKRLNRVVIENLNFNRLIKIYDRPRSLFYLDPPYHNAEKYYDVDFGEPEHRQLCEQLKTLKGKFILSYNDDAWIRDLYKDFNIESISRPNNLAARHNGDHQYRELLISNY